MSKQTPMMQLREKLLEECNKHPYHAHYAQGYMEALKSIANDIRDNMLPIEQQAFEYAFDDGVMEGQDKSIYDYPINGMDYYNQTYKS